MKTWIVDAETVHNWRNRAHEWEGYYGDMPATAHKAIETAHDKHHRDGLNARECAVELAARFPCLESR